MPDAPCCFDNCPKYYHSECCHLTYLSMPLAELNAQVASLRLAVGRELGRRAMMDDAPLAHDVDAVGVAEHEGELLLDQEDRGAGLLERRDEPAQLAHHERRQPLGRLVHQQKIG